MGLHLAAISPLAFQAPMHAAPSRVTMTVELPALTPGGAEYAKTMPGLGPFGFFDPLGTTEEKTVEEIVPRGGARPWARGDDGVARLPRARGVPPDLCLG